MRLYVYMLKSEACDVPFNFDSCSSLEQTYVILRSGKHLFFLYENGDLEDVGNYLPVSRCEKLVKSGKWSRYRVYSKYITKDMRSTHTLWSKYKNDKDFDILYSHFDWTSAKRGRLFMLRHLTGTVKFLSYNMLEKWCVRYLCVGTKVGACRIISRVFFESFWVSKARHRAPSDVREVFDPSNTASSIFLLGESEKILGEMERLIEGKTCKV